MEEIPGKGVKYISECVIMRARGPLGDERR